MTSERKAFRTGMLLVALLGLLALPIGSAGTQESPEISDAAGDASGTAPSDGIDLIAAFIPQERQDVLILRILVAGSPIAGNTDVFTFDASFDVGNTTVQAGVLVESTGSTPTGATQVASLTGNTVELRIHRVNNGIAPGLLLTNLQVTSTHEVALLGNSLGSDDMGTDGSSIPYLIGSLAEAGVDYDDDGLDDVDELALGTDGANPDTDGDTLLDGFEVNNLGTDPLLADTDGDGLDDGVEANGSTDPRLADQDEDGLNDGEEVALGTDPKAADSDADGATDGEEVAAGSDPNNADTDGDGIKDGAELDRGTSPLTNDTDGDGMLDEDELRYGFDVNVDDANEDDDNDGVSNIDEINEGTDPTKSDRIFTFLPPEITDLEVFILLAILLILIILLIVLIVYRRRTKDAREAKKEAKREEREALKAQRAEEKEQRALEKEEAKRFETAPSGRRRLKPVEIESEENLEPIDLVVRRRIERDRKKPVGGVSRVHEDYATENLDPEAQDRVRRLYEEEEYERRERLYPNRDRRLDGLDVDADDLVPVAAASAEEGEASEDFQMDAKEERKLHKAAKKALKEQAKLDRKAAKEAAKAEKRQAKQAKRDAKANA